MWHSLSIISLITELISTKSIGKSLFISSVLLLSLNPISNVIQPASAASGDLLLTLTNPTPEIGDGFGVSVASTPDGNVIVGAFQDNFGSVYLFDGNTGALLLTINNPTPGFDFFGRSVASTPDGNVIVGAWLDDTGAVDAGSAYLFDVSTCDNAAGSTPGDNVCEIPELTINNPTPEITDEFGWSVASTPDGNIIVGAAGDDTGAVDAGSAYLFDGTTGALLLTINNPTPELSDHFGIYVASTPDGNIIVGAWEDNTGAAKAGSAYLFDGITGSLLLTINNPTPEFVDLFGVSAASTPDGNVIVGAWKDNTGAVDAGSAYLFLASSPPSQTVEERLTALEAKTTDLESTVSDMFNFVIEQFTNLFAVFPSVQTDVSDLQAQVDALEDRIAELENP